MNSSQIGLISVVIIQTILGYLDNLYIHEYSNNVNFDVIYAN